MIHHKKIWTTYFEAVVDGSKTFEVRLDPDNEIHNGDFIMLEEVDAVLQRPTGRQQLVQVTYTVRGPFEQAGLPDGTVVMSIVKQGDVRENKPNS